MGSTMTVLAALGGFVSAVVVGLIGTEINAWMPRLSQWILVAAVRRMPLENRDRYAEEWAAHVAEYPGNLSKLAQSLLLFRACISLRERKNIQTYDEIERILKFSIFNSSFYFATMWALPTQTWIDRPLSAINFVSGMMCARFTYLLVKHRRIAYDEFRQDLKKLARKE